MRLQFSPALNDRLRISTTRIVAGLLSAAFVASLPTSATASAVVAGFDSQNLPANDDGSTGAVNIGFTANFFGQIHDTLFVNNNGNITFVERLGTFTPFELTSTSRQIIAPFFADVDTRAGAIVSYGQGTFEGRNAFGVNWPGVGYFPSSVDKINIFQLLLVDRSDMGVGDFDIIFNYDQVEWETGGASGGSNGLGGSSARVGFSNGSGDPGTFFELEGSAINGAFLDSGPASTALIRNSLGSPVLGRYLFRARSGDVTPGPVIPEPSTLTLSGMAGVGLMGFLWFRRMRPSSRRVSIA